jgi:hypothetical protein
VSQRPTRRRNGVTQRPSSRPHSTAALAGALALRAASCHSRSAGSAARKANHKHGADAHIYQATQSSAAAKAMLLPACTDISVEGMVREGEARQE